MSVNERLKLIRKSTGLGQSAFGKTINVGQSGLDRYEKDGYELPNSVITTIVTVYNIHTDWLIFGHGGEDIRYRSEFVDKSEYELLNKRLCDVQEMLIKYQGDQIEKLEMETEKLRASNRVQTLS